MKTDVKNTVYFTESCQRLMVLLDFGESCALTQKQITEYTGFTRSFTEKLIRGITERNVVICSSNKGRFYPETTDELERYVKRLSRSAGNDSCILISAKNKLRKWKERL